MRLLAIAALLLALPLSDNFNDGVIDTNLWTSGTGFYVNSLNYNGATTVDESTGQLVFIHPGNSIPYWSANAYVTNATYDVRDRRVSAKLQRNGADAWLAVGTSEFEMADVTLLNGGGSALRFETVDISTYDQHHYFWIQAADYDPVEDAYVALRFTRRGVYCETSADGVNWITRGLIKGKLDFAANARIELGGGGYFPFATQPVTSTIDDFKIEP